MKRTLEVSSGTIIDSKVRSSYSCESGFLHESGISLSNFILHLSTRTRVQQFTVNSFIPRLLLFQPLGEFLTQLLFVLFSEIVSKTGYSSREDEGKAENINLEFG